MTPENAAALIEFAGTHSCRETEREIARLNPKASRPDRIRPVAENLNEIQGTISDQVNEKLKRAESLMAQKGKATDLNSVLEAALDEYIKHHDPLKKALRAIARLSAKSEVNSRSRQNSKAATDLLRTRKKQFLGELSDDPEKTGLPRATSIREPDREPENASTNPTATYSSESSSSFASHSLRLRSSMDSSTASQSRLSVPAQKRVPLTAEEKHFVFHRDEGRCTHLDENCKRCGSDRWIDVHHIVEVSRGGTNEPSNLTLFCSFHHDAVHQLSLALDAGQFNWLREPRSRYS